MRNLFAFLLVAFFTTTIQAQDTQAALAYMEDINNAVDDTQGETWRYLKAATKGRSARTMERKREALVDEIGDVIGKVRKIGGFKGDRAYQTEVLNYLKLTHIVIREDYSQIMDMEDIAERSYDDMEAYLLAKEIASEKMDSALTIYQNAQEEFASKHNIELVEGEKSRRQEKIAKASKALGYYNNIFLIFFRANVQESYVIDAMNRNDLVSLEQNINALKSATAMAQEALDTVSKFEGDPKLIVAAQQMLKFYQNEAERDFPEVVDFYVKKENFERLAKMMESKKKRDLTEEDIANYNKAVEEYNALIPKFNSANERTNNKRNEMLERWNDRLEEFFDAHS